MIGRIRGVWRFLKKQWRDADAQDLVEYALLLMMVGLAAVASMKSLAGTIQNAFFRTTMEMVALPGTGALGNGSNVGNDQAAANLNGALAAVDGTQANQEAAAAASELAAAAAALGVNDSTRAVSNALATRANANNIAAQADFAAFNGNNVAAGDYAAAQADALAAQGFDNLAAFAAGFGINNGPLGSNSLAADANAETAAAAQATAGATGKTAVSGSFIGL